MTSLRAHGRVQLVLLLPLLVVTTAVGVIAFNVSQRATFVDQLTMVIEQGAAEDALAVVHQLATLERPPVNVLVVAAASRNSQVASAGKQTIRNLLDDFDEQVNSSRNIANVADSLSELMAALFRRQKTFAAADQAWIAETTHTVLRLANKMPPHVAPTLATECDAILTATDVVALAQAAFAASKSTPTNTASASRRFANSITNRSASELPAQPSPTAPAAGVPPFARTSAPPIQSPADASRTATATDNATSPINAQLRSPATLAPRNQLRAIDLPNQPTSPIAAAVQPVPSGKASISIVPPPAANSSTDLPQFRRPAAFAIQQLPTLDSRSLLAALQSEHGASAVAIEDELARRGFGKVNNRLVDQFLSDDFADRLRLVEFVLNDSSLGPRPWLLLLAEDEHADVRLLAITVLATSGDAALLEKVWQIAIRDRDPRIADLAPRLRDRQSTARRQ